MAKPTQVSLEHFAKLPQWMVDNLNAGGTLCPFCPVDHSPGCPSCGRENVERRPRITDTVWAVNGDMEREKSRMQEAHEEVAAKYLNRIGTLEATNRDMGTDLETMRHTITRKNEEIDGQIEAIRTGENGGGRVWVIPESVEAWKKREHLKLKKG